MKFKNVVLVLAMGLVSMVSCLADGIEMKVNNPYSLAQMEITIPTASAYYCFNGKTNDNIWLGQSTDSLTFALFFEFADQKIVLDRGHYHADAQAINISGTKEIETKVLVNGQIVKVIYKINIDYGQEEENPTIKSFALDLLNISLDGVEIEKHVFGRHQGTTVFRNKPCCN